MKNINNFGVGVRWKIAILLCLISGLNCLDRNTLAILASTIQKDLFWTDSDYANITAVFVLSYTLMYAFSGRIVDYIGTRKGFSIFAGGWSFISMLHAFAYTITQFSVVRFFLGIAESANFPAGIKACTEWFPLKERALAIGLFNAGTAVGAALAVPIVSFLSLRFGWRFSFIITGILGFIWLLFWLKYYHLPQNHPKITEEEKQLLLRNDNKPGISGKVRLKELLRRKETWGCFSARIFIDPVTYFLLFWIPKYLQDEQGFSLSELGVTAWLPYTAMGIGTILGGLFPKLLIDKCNWSLNKARKTIMLIASFSIPLLCYILFQVTNPLIAVFTISGIMLSHGLWANITIPSEIYPNNVQATITGIGGTLGGITSVISQKAIGMTIGTYSYFPIFIYISLAYLISYVSVSILVGKLGIMHNFNNN